MTCLGTHSKPDNDAKYTFYVGDRSLNSIKKSLVSSKTIGYCCCYFILETRSYKSGPGLEASSIMASISHAGQRKGINLTQMRNLKATETTGLAETFSWTNTYKGLVLSL